MPQYFSKQPNEIKDYEFDWEDWLEPTLTDAIVSATVSVSPSGITFGSMTINSTNVIQVISGGIDGVDYKITCLMTTAQGRVDEEEIYISVREL